MERLRDWERAMAKITGFGEIMLRLATPRGQVLDGTQSLEVDFGGAEANTIIALARLGHDAQFVTGLPDNDWGPPRGRDAGFRRRAAQYEVY